MRKYAAEVELRDGRFRGDEFGGSGVVWNSVSVSQAERWNSKLGVNPDVKREIRNGSSTMYTVCSGVKLNRYRDSVSVSEYL